MKGFFKIILNLIVIALAMFVGIKIGQQQKNHINYDTFIQQIEDTNLLEHEKLNFENKINNKIDLEQNRNMINEININDNTNEFNNEMNEEASTQETFKNDIIIQENLNFEEQNKNVKDNVDETNDINNQINNVNNDQQLENNNKQVPSTNQVPTQAVPSTNQVPAQAVPSTNQVPAQAVPEINKSKDTIKLPNEITKQAL